MSTITELFKRAASLTDENRGTGRTFAITIQRSDDLFHVDSDQTHHDGQGDTIEDALASFVAHIEAGALRAAADAEDRARRIRGALAGEKP